MRTRHGRIALRPAGRECTHIRFCAVLPTSLCVSGVRLLARVISAAGPVSVVLPAGVPSTEWFDHWCMSLVDTPEGLIEIRFTTPLPRRSGGRGPG